VETVTNGAIGDTLRALRERAGLTRAELAELAAVSESTVKSIEYRDSERPRPETLRSLARGLATSRMTGRIDAEQAERLYAGLLHSAGYAAETTSESARQLAELPPDLYEAVLALANVDEGVLRAILQDLSQRDESGQRSALRMWQATTTWQREEARRGRRRR
jgi:transcriptional regulator with XRE-family HTH domain